MEVAASTETVPAVDAILKMLTFKLTNTNILSYVFLINS